MMTMTMERINISTGTPWEESVGYSRAVRVGSMVFVTGTIAADETGALIGRDDPYAQTIFIIRKIERSLVEAGASLRDVVRTRMYVANLDQWEAIARGHREMFADIRPCTTMVEVARLFEDAAVEIEADAVIAGDE